MLNQGEKGLVKEATKKSKSDNSLGSLFFQKHTCYLEFWSLFVFIQRKRTFWVSAGRGFRFCIVHTYEEKSGSLFLSSITEDCPFFRKVGNFPAGQTRKT